MSYQLYDMSSARINARIDEESVRRMEYLEARLGVSTSELVRRAIHELYERERGRDGPSVLETLEAAGFLGQFEGDPELSARYKDELQSGWSDKA